MFITFVVAVFLTLLGSGLGLLETSLPATDAVEST